MIKMTLFFFHQTWDKKSVANPFNEHFLQVNQRFSCFIFIFYVSRALSAPFQAFFGIQEPNFMSYVLSMNYAYCKKAKNQGLNSPQGINSWVKNYFFLKFFSLQCQNLSYFDTNCNFLGQKIKWDRFLKICPSYQKRVLTTKDCCEQIKIKLMKIS